MSKKKKISSKFKKAITAIVIMLVLLVGVRFIYTSFRDDNTKINLDDLSSDTIEISCPVFDGNEIWEESTVVIKDGVITDETSLKKGNSSSNYFLMPGLIDAHAHLTTPYQMELLVKNAVTTVCDVSASEDLEKSYGALKVWSSRTSVWLDVDNAEAFVKNTVAKGGKYIKVVADLPQIMGGGVMEKAVLEELVHFSHENNLKVAVHAISVKGVQMAVDCGVDLLIHVPIGESFPLALAEEIAEKNIAVMPTLAMMKAFADSPFYGYKKDDYNDAKETVKLLNSLNVPILGATDSSDSFFVPQLKHGKTLHKEMELLVDAGLTPLEVLKSVTTKSADAFDIGDAGVIAAGMRATMVLIEGRPDKEITDSSNILQVWIDGKPVFENVAIDGLYKAATTKGEENEKDNSTEIVLVKAGVDNMENNELIFYPKHPSAFKTHRIETKAMPTLKQDKPFEAKDLCDEFCLDLNKALSVYEDKRFEVTGIASKIGPDIHNKPSIEISNEVGGQCYALCIFPSDDFYNEVSVGDRVTVKANYLVMSNQFGVVMKYSELVETK